MKRIKVKKLLVGATFWAVGYAWSQPESLIVERGIHPGHEFSDCWRWGGECETVCSQKEGKRLKNDLLQRGIISRDHDPVFQAYASVLSQLIHEKKITVLLSAQLMKEDNTVFLVTPWETVIAEAEEIIDTTAEKTGRKSINALVWGERIRDGAGLKWQPSSREQIGYLRYAMDANVTLADARRMLYKEFLTRRSNQKIIATAEEFEYHYTSPVPGISASSRNPIQAFDRGVQSGKEGTLR